MYIYTKPGSLEVLFGGRGSAPNIESGADAKSIQVPMSSLLSPALAEP